MKDRMITDLTDIELQGAIGGDWNWSDFSSGVSWALGLGCFASANPFLCGGALVVGGMGFYF